MQRFLLLVTYTVGMAALVLAGIIAYEGYRETRRLNGEIVALEAQIAELTGGSTALQPVADSTEQSASDIEIATLKNRIAILEEAWRSQGSSTAALPPLQPAGDTATAASTGEDCVPAGIGFLAQAGQQFAVCGTDVTVGVTSIGAADVTLAGGGAATVGGQSLLEGTNCAVTLLTVDSTTGYAELRVNCS